MIIYSKMKITRNQIFMGVGLIAITIVILYFSRPTVEGFSSPTPIPLPEGKQLTHMIQVGNPNQHTPLGIFLGDKDLKLTPDPKTRGTITNNGLFVPFALEQKDVIAEVIRAHGGQPIGYKIIKVLNELNKK